MSNAKDLIVSAIVSALTALVVVWLVLSLGHGSVKSGSVDSTCQGTTTCLTDLYVSGGTQIGTTVLLSGTLQLSSVGTVLNGINSGTCFIHPYATTIAATTTAQVDCQATKVFAYGPGSALSGITAADTIMANLGSTTAGTVPFGPLRIRAEYGSTTPGYITFILDNTTGGTYTWSITANASGTAQYIATR